MECEDRAWEGLPCTALVQIFRSLSLEDRLFGGPLVCEAWNQASKDPRCWESMLALGESVEDLFIKYPHHSPHSFTTKQFHELIERALGRVTTLHLSAIDSDLAEDRTLALIANRCPALKHLSLQDFWEVKSKGGFLQLMNKCKDLELLDLNACLCLSPATLEDMGRCWPNLRGLRWCGDVEYPLASSIAASFPQLKLLNLSGSTLCNRGLDAILNGCTSLEFLDITDCEHLEIGESVRERCANNCDLSFDIKYDSTEDSDYLDRDEFYSMMREMSSPDYMEGDSYWSCCGNPCSGGVSCNSCDNGGTMRMTYEAGHIVESHWPW